MKYLLLFALMGCIKEPEAIIENVIEPEVMNNLVTRKVWDFCCRICMKGKKVVHVRYEPDDDTLICQCTKGYSASINIME